MKLQVNYEHYNNVIFNTGIYDDHKCLIKILDVFHNF